MKADRLMRVNGRQNLWLLRNTNQIYDNAVKSYYKRSNSLLSNNTAFQHAKEREEHQAPVRTLTSSQRMGRTPTTEYPRNHRQMAEQVANANANNLLNTVMQANRRRSMSFSAGGLRMYGKSRGVFGSSPASSSTLLTTSNTRGRNRRTSATEAAEMDADQFDASILRGRSMSLPARTTLALGMGMGYVMGRQRETSREPEPSSRHHLTTIERTRRQLEQQQRANSCLSDDGEQPLMVVDKALKQRLAVKLEQATETGLFGGAGFVDNRQLTSRAPTAFAANREQPRFHTLGERIRQFEVMQFADGPVKFKTFNRRQDYGSGRPQQQPSNRNVPKQEPTLGYRNVLHTNHRLRALNYLMVESETQLKQQPEEQQQARQKAMMMMMAKRKASQAEKNVMPLGPLGSLAPNLRPQQQQQQQQQQPYSNTRQFDDDAFSTTPKHNKHKKLMNSKSKKSVNSNSSSRSSKAFKDEVKRVPSAMQLPAVNKITRSSHVAHIRDSNASRRQQLLPRRLAEQLQSEHKVKAQPQKLPQQPQTLKGVNHLLAASASQVSANKRATKSRQQILQAEMLHMQAQQESLIRQQQQQQQQQQQRKRQQQQRQKHKEQQVEQKRQQPKQEQQMQRLQQLQQRQKLQHQQQEQLKQQQHQHLQRIQQQQQQQQQQLAFLPKGAKKHTMLQPKSEPKPPAKMQQQQRQQQQQQKLPQVKSVPSQKKKQQQQLQLESKKPTANQQQQSATAELPLPVETSQKRRRLNLLANKPATATTTASTAVAASGHATAVEHNLSTSFQRTQQHQLHQQLRQRRQQPYESLWRHTF